MQIDWPLVLVWAVFLAGVFAAGFLFYRSPDRWIRLAKALFVALWPYIWAFVSKRKSAEDEAAWRREQLTKPNPQPMPSKHPKRDR